jgi:hypothetical protein
MTAKISTRGLTKLALRVAVAAVLDEHCRPEWKFFQVRDTWPHFILVSPHGSVRFLKLKRRGAKVIQDQSDFCLHCVKYGIPYCIAYTVGEALAALIDWGCLRAQ